MPAAIASYTHGVRSWRLLQSTDVRVAEQTNIPGAGLPRAVVSLNVSSVGDKMLDIETWGTVPATLITIGLATYIAQSHCTMPTYAEYGLILMSAGIILSSVGLITYKLKTRQP